MKRERLHTPDKRRVLCIGPLPPPVHGSAMMTQIIKDSTFINDRIILDWVNLSTSRKIEEIGHGSFTKLGRFTASYFKTFWKLMTRKYDACYIAITCHGTGFLKDAPFALMCKLAGHKLILHQHNKGMAADVDRPIFRWLLKKVYSGAKVILLSWHLFPDIEKIVSQSQVTICPNGIPDAPMVKSSHQSRPRFLFLSNLMESKGVITVLDACRQLKHRGYIFECRFVGGETIEIDNSRFNKEKSSRGLDGEVVYAGRKYGDDKHREFSEADIFVFPTSDDCFPLVLLEAMQHSLPVISTEIGGIPDMVEDGANGLIVPVNDAARLADAMARLLDSPQERERFGRNGKEKLNSKYTLRRFEENIFACLNQDI